MPKKKNPRQIATDIVKKLQSKGFEAYFAGGSVRDMLMRKRPKDFDIATSAKPEEIEKIIKKTIPVGKEFGVIIAVVDHSNFEIATFRSDSGYSDGRRPDYVIYTSAEEDAERRDFTINGMFYNPINKKVIDYVGGKKDLKKKVVRFIGNPDKRIVEDNLRILRAVRFKNTLGFKYHKDTLEVVKKHARKILNVSWERIHEELNKILESENRVEGIKDLSDTKILRYILPEVEKMKGVEQNPEYHREGDVFIHTLLVLKYLPKKCDLNVVWATFLHDLGKPDTQAIKDGTVDEIWFKGHVPLSAEIASDVLKRLRFSKKDRDEVIWLIKNHMILSDILNMREAKKLRWLTDPRLDKLLTLHYADSKGSKPAVMDVYKKVKRLQKKALKEVPPEIPKIISGEDIMKEFKIEAGPKVGELLEKVKDAQITGKVKTKKQALDYLKRVKS